LDGSPPITRTTFPTCRAHYPGGSSGCACRLLPRSCSLPQMAGGSASALSLSRPAQASLTLRPTGLLNRLKRPLSRGSSPAGYPTEPLVSYQINRQLSGWNLPPLVIRAFGANGQTRRFRTATEESGPLPITDIRCQRLTLIGLDLTVRRYARSRTGYQNTLVRMANNFQSIALRVIVIGGQRLSAPPGEQRGEGSLGRIGGQV